MKEKGISTLVLVFIIAAILAMVIFVLQPISLLAARRASQIRYSQTAFFAAEGAMYVTIQHLRDNEDPNWPDFSGVDGEDVFNYTIGEADGKTEIRRVITQTDDGVKIDITATIKGRKRRIVATFVHSEEGRMPLDIMLVIDRSGSMSWREDPDDPNTSAIEYAKGAAGTFVNLIKTSNQDITEGKDQIGLVQFHTNAQIRQELTEEYDDVITEINILSAGGATNIADAIAKAVEELGSLNARDEATKIIILFSDGVPQRSFTSCTGCVSDVCLAEDYGTYPTVYDPDNQGNCCTQDALTQADDAKASDITIFSIYLSTYTSSTTANCDQGCRNIIRDRDGISNAEACTVAKNSAATLGRLILLRASNEPPTRPLPDEDDEPYTYYKETDDPGELDNIYGELAGFIGSSEFFELQEETPEPN